MKVICISLTFGTILSAFSPTATFAKTVEGDANANANGSTELPMTDKTTVGISFGDNTDNGNTGYLRLQMVPHILDFGNHTEFLAQYPTFDASGHNISIKSNDRFGSFDGSNTNKTAVLNTEDRKLTKVKGKSWVTVVDKQVQRDSNSITAPNNARSGNWYLSVKADSTLTSINGEKIPNANLIFKDTQYGRTGEVFTLTNEDQDKDFNPDADDAAYGLHDNRNVTDYSKNILVPVEKSPTEYKVAYAEEHAGRGANVFAWSRNNIKLSVPKSTKVNNVVYQAQLTWTLSTGY